MLHYAGMEYELDADPARIQRDVVWAWLSTEAYWGRQRTRADVDTQLDGAWRVVGAYRRDTGEQVGFARAVSDGVTFAYLADVFVLESHRGRGLAKLLMDAVVAHPELQGLRRWMLATRDAHALYAQYGFTPLPAPEVFMQLHDPGVYSRGGSG